MTEETMTQPAERRTEPSPGPWEWDAGDVGQDYSVPYCNVFVDGGDLIIAQVNDRFSREIGRANARLIAAAPATAAERDRLKAWVDDLQSGMYVNCVYCGHRYGPGETTPVTMADALKEHIEQCPEHPMSRLKAANAELVTALAAVPLFSESCHGIGGRWLCLNCDRRTENPHVLLHKGDCWVPMVQAVLAKAKESTS